MKCPLTLKAQFHEAAYITTIGSNCLEEECAWWDKTMEQCDPTGFLPHLIAIGNVLGRIADQLPREFTPRST